MAQKGIAYLPTLTAAEAYAEYFHAYKRGQTPLPARVQQVLDAYHAEHELICLDPDARNLRHTYVRPSEDKRTWLVQQMLIDPEEHNDWVAEFAVDLEESRKRSEPVLILRRMGNLVADGAS